MSLPIVYIQIVEEGRIIELRLESFDLADDLAKTIKALPAITRVLSEWRWLPEPKAEAAQVVPAGDESTGASPVSQEVLLPLAKFLKATIGILQGELDGNAPDLLERCLSEITYAQQQLQKRKEAQP